MGIFSRLFRSGQDGQPASGDADKSASDESISDDELASATDEVLGSAPVLAAAVAGGAGAMAAPLWGWPQRHNEPRDPTPSPAAEATPPQQESTVSPPAEEPPPSAKRAAPPGVAKGQAGAHAEAASPEEARASTSAPERGSANSGAGAGKAGSSKNHPSSGKLGNNAGPAPVITAPAAQAPVGHAPAAQTPASSHSSASPATGPVASPASVPAIPPPPAPSSPSPAPSAHNVAPSVIPPKASERPSRPSLSPATSGLQGSRRRDDSTMIMSPPPAPSATKPAPSTSPPPASVAPPAAAAKPTPAAAAPPAAPSSSSSPSSASSSPSTAASPSRSALIPAASPLPVAPAASVAPLAAEPEPLPEAVAAPLLPEPPKLAEPDPDAEESVANLASTVGEDGFPLTSPNIPMPIMGDEISESFNRVFFDLGGDPKLGSAEAAGISTASDLQAVRDVFNDIAVVHVSQVRDVMLELRFGDADPAWLESTKPALRSLRAMAEQMELVELCRALDVFCEAVDGAVANRARINEEAKAELLTRYQRLSDLIPQAFELDAERDRREPIIVEALLYQIDGVEKPVIDRLFAVGLNRLDALLRANLEDLVMMSGVRREVAEAIVDQFRTYRATADAAVSTRDPAAERRSLGDLVIMLSILQDDFLRAGDDWTEDARLRKRSLRKEREQTFQRIRVSLVRLGDRDQLSKLERLPFTERIAALERYVANQPPGRP